MATYTADKLKEYTSAPAVGNWSDDKILLYQSMAESILTSLDLDSTMTGYLDAYNSSVVLIFDWVAANPGMLSAARKGKVNSKFKIEDLPGPIQIMLQSFVDGAGGTLTGAPMQRNDIGLR